jgi:hypothetical protein
MNKTIWFLHDAWYTSLQLLEFDVGVEVLLLVVCLACPAPPCGLMLLGYLLWW